MWPRSDLTDLLGIDHPIIQAPMAGSDGPALAAAVSNAGGVGSLGCGEMSVEKLRKEFDRDEGFDDPTVHHQLFCPRYPRVSE